MYRVLTNRGIPLQDIDHYLHTTKDDLLDPLLLDRINEGAQMLIKHIVNEDRIYILVDSDADGYTSAAALINYLNMIFPGITQNYIRYGFHKGKQHGLTEDHISMCIEKQYRLIIAPDSSSNNYDIHEQMKKYGIDVLVLDHHIADYVSENACVINNQLCDYPNKSLSGVGVVYKFCSYIDSILNNNQADNLLDLVAIGLIADMMDLRNFETRYLITEGLSNLRNPFIKAMNKAQNYQISKHDGLNPFTVGFYIAPLVNAVTRVGTLEEKEILFESMLDFKGYEQIPSTKRGCKGQMETRVEQACRVCNNVKNRQATAVDSNLKIIEELIEENNLLDNKILTIQLPVSLSIEKNITGLVANKLMSKYQRPVLILNQTERDNKICWEGSGRGNVKNFRDLLLDTKEPIYVEGHQLAFGIGITNDNIKDFIKDTNIILHDLDSSIYTDVDFIWQANNINKQDIFNLAEGQWLWGQDISKPIVAIENIKINKDNIQLMKGTTFKITLPNDITLIKFGSSEEEFNKLYKEFGYTTINIIGECKKNEWNGFITPQIEIQDFEIIGESLYDF